MNMLPCEKSFFCHNSESFNEEDAFLSFLISLMVSQL